MCIVASAFPFRFLAQPLFQYVVPVVSSVPETEHGCSKNFEKRRSGLNAPKFLRGWCATNADCRLADCQVNEENLVVECFNRFPIPKFKVI